MSYYIKIGMAEAKTADEFLAAIRRMRAELWNQGGSIIKDRLRDPETCRILKNAGPDVIMAWIKSVLSLKLVWWRRYGMLGSYGPGEFKGLVPVEFQSSRDRDYPPDAYPQNIPFFKKLTETVRDMPEQEIVDTMGQRGWDGTDDVGYLRRTLLYETIEDALEIRSITSGWDLQADDITYLDICAVSNDRYASALALVTIARREIQRQESLS